LGKHFDQNENVNQLFLLAKDLMLLLKR